MAGKNDTVLCTFSLSLCLNYPYRSFGVLYFILLERREERSHVIVIVMCGVLNVRVCGVLYVRVCVCGRRGVIRRVSEYVWAGREGGREGGVVYVCCVCCMKVLCYVVCACRVLKEN